jgi:hypothetical protein
MTGEIVPNPKLLMADADREGVVTRLHTAVAEGRITLSEFEERMSGVLAARTFADVTPYVEDLPGLASSEPIEISAWGSSISRTGRWTVPSHIRVAGTGSSVVLDFTEALLTSNVIRIDVDLRGSSLKMIVPLGSTIDAGATSLTGSSVRTRKLMTQSGAGQSATHYVITGQIFGSAMKVRPPLRWFWQRRR